MFWPTSGAMLADTARLENVTNRRRHKSYETHNLYKLWFDLMAIFGEHLIPMMEIRLSYSTPVTK